MFSNYSSHAEFAQFGGLPVRVTYQPEIHHAIMRSTIDTNHAVEQTLKLRRSKDLRLQLGASGRKHAFQYTTAHTVSSWDKVFTEMMKEPLPLESGKLFATHVS